jgi:hypothetical protein
MLLRSSTQSRKLREGDQRAPTPEVKSGTPGTNDVAETAACRNRSWQGDFRAARCLWLAKGGGDGLQFNFALLGIALICAALKIFFQLSSICRNSKFT